LQQLDRAARVEQHARISPAADAMSRGHERSAQTLAAAQAQLSRGSQWKRHRRAIRRVVRFQLAKELGEPGVHLAASFGCEPGKPDELAHARSAPGAPREAWKD
jgi:hypothetical protein